MDKGRLEAFSDGVIAIIITIMALELQVPRGTGSSHRKSFGAEELEGCSSAIPN